MDPLESLLTYLPILGLCISFVVVIFLVRKKTNFGLSLFIGSLIVALFSLKNTSISDIANAASNAVIYSFKDQRFNTETIELAILLTLISILANCMQKTGAIDKLITSLKSIFHKGGTLGLIPAIYGLMPVPGGALFSAPLIDKEGNYFKLNKNQKNFLNVWFRHIWFPIFPVSSAVLLLCSAKYANIDIYQLLIANSPSFIVFVFIGIIYLKYFTKNVKIEKYAGKKDFKGLIYLFPPIIPILLYVVLFIIGFPNLKDNQRNIFNIGVLVSIVLLFFIINIDFNKYFKIIKESISFNLALIIFGIMIFRQLIDVSGAADQIGLMVGNLPFHPIIIIILIPLILGLITGYNLGAIALSYLLVYPFFYSSGLNIIGFASIIFISSLVGYLISPIHLCNVVSSDYLKTETTSLYKMYVPSILTLLIIQSVFVVIFYHI